MTNLNLTVPSHDFLISLLGLDPGWSVTEQATVIRLRRLVAHPSRAIFAFRFPGAAEFTGVALYPSIDAVIDRLLPTSFKSPACWQTPLDESEEHWRGRNPRHKATWRPPPGRTWRRSRLCGHRRGALGARAGRCAPRPEGPLRPESRSHGGGCLPPPFTTGNADSKPSPQ